VQVGSHEALRRRLDIAVPKLDLDPEPFQPLEVEVDGPGPDGAAARKRDTGFLEAGHEGSENEDGGAHGLDEIVRNLEAIDILRVNREGLSLVKRGSQVIKERLGGADIAEPGEIADSMNPATEEGRREDRERCILRAADPHLAMEGSAPFDEDLIHEISSTHDSAI
jgi:hypothetical protein